MAFPEIDSEMIPLLSDVNDIPDDLDLIHEDGCYFLRIPIAESEDGRWLVTVDAGYIQNTDTCPCEGVKPLDFVSFGYEITAFDQWEGVLYQTMDPRETAGAVPQDIRSIVVDIVCGCYLKLLGICDPIYVFRNTWISEPSENALKKHTKCTETLTQSGYTVLKVGTDQHGCKFWLLGKSDSDHSDLERSGLEEQLGAES